MMARASWLDQSPVTTGRKVIHSENRNAMEVPKATSTSIFAEPPLSEPHALR